MLYIWGLQLTWFQEMQEPSRYNHGWAFLGTQLSK